MIVTEILGNTHEPSGRQLVGDRHVERVVLPGPALVKRIQRLTTICPYSVLTTMAVMNLLVITVVRFSFGSPCLLQH